MREIGRYTLEGEVARGGMGRVYRARTPEGQQVALKLLLAGRQAVETQRTRLRREAEAMLRLDHPGVVRILDAGEHEGTPFLVLEWVEGQDLGAWLAQEGPIDPREAAALVARLGRALEHCHQRGVLHRDLKPQNVLLRASDGAPLLTDFGLSLSMDAELDALTRTGQCLGSPGYWPPEQALGQRDQVDERSDVWGLGGILYTLLTGRPPLDGSSLVDALAALERGVPPPSALRPGTPATLDDVCVRCLTSARERRFPSALAVARALEDWLAAGAPTGRPGRRGGGALMVVGVALLAAGAGALIVRRARGAASAEQGPSPSDPAGPGPASATQDPPGEVTGLVAEGAALRRKGRLLESLGRLDRAVALAPQDVPARLARASLRRNMGDLQGAMHDLEAALAEDPTHVLALVERGHVLARLDRWNELAQGVEVLEGLAPDHPGSLTLRGLYRGHVGDEVESRELVERALERDPRHIEGLLLEGLLLDRMDRLEEARPYYDQALALDPHNSRALGRRATLLGQQGRLEESRVDFELALQIDPQNVLHLVNFANVLNGLGEKQRAWAMCEQALRLQPDEPDALLLLGQMRRERGDRAGALTDLTRAAELAPEDPSPQFWLGVIQMETGALQAGLVSAQRALDLDPLDAQSWLLRGELRERLGVPGARDDFLRFAELAPTHERAAEALARAERLAR